MKSTMVEGVPDSRIKRLQMHLLRVEELTGGKLRRTPRGSLCDCPIENFSPSKDERGDYCLCGVWAGKRDGLHYNGQQTYTVYRVYKATDGWWWKDLPFVTRIDTTKYIANWIKDGKKL